MRGVLVFVALLCAYYGVDAIIERRAWEARWGEQWRREHSE